MKILSIETSSKICSTCILEDEKIIKKIELNNGFTHSESLMPIIKQIFNETKLSLNNIDLLVCDIGPGSFTGIRIGVATTKAFSDSLNIKSIGITSLEALAYNVNNSGFICSIIDAKNKNCYFALYKLENGIYSEIIAPKAEKIENLINYMQNIDTSITFVGDGAFIYKDFIKSIFTKCILVNNNFLDSYKLGLAGFINFSNNKYKELLPMYLKKPQAQIQLEEKSNVDI